VGRLLAKHRITRALQRQTRWKAGTQNFRSTGSHGPTTAELP